MAGSSPTFCDKTPRLRGRHLGSLISPAPPSCFLWEVCIRFLGFPGVMPFSTF